MINRVHYTAHSRMADLLSEHYNIFSLISRLGIPLGMGDHTIREVCEANGVDTDTFMYLVHFDLYPDLREALTPDLETIDVAQIISFLRTSHRYFLEVRLPDIGEALDVALEGAPHDIRVVVKHYFADYCKEVRNHMHYEDEVVFPYAEGLLRGEEGKKDYNITNFERHHDQVELKMHELKNLFLKYYTWEANLKLYNVLHDLYACGEELLNHNDIENLIFIPCIKALEKSTSR